MQGGANTETTDKTGKTPLFKAFKFNNREITRLLVDKGAHRQAQDLADNTLLHSAVAHILEPMNFWNKSKVDEATQGYLEKQLNETLETLQLLIQLGVDRTIKNKADQAPRDLLLACQDKVIAKELLNALGTHSEDLHQLVVEGDQESIKLLIALDVNVNAFNHRGKTPLYLAVEQGNLKIVRLRVDAGANVLQQGIISTNQPDEEERPQLDQAILEGDPELVRALLQAEAAVEHQGGKPALHLAAQQGYGELVEAFIKQGANICDQDQYGWTPCKQPKRTNSPAYSCC